MIASYVSYFRIKLDCNLHLFCMEEIWWHFQALRTVPISQVANTWPFAERNSIYGGVIGTCDYGKSLLGTCVICRSPLLTPGSCFGFCFWFCLSGGCDGGSDYRGGN